MNSVRADYTSDIFKNKKKIWKTFCFLTHKCFKFCNSILFAIKLFCVRGINCAILIIVNTKVLIYFTHSIFQKKLSQLPSCIIKSFSIKLKSNFIVCKMYLLRITRLIECKYMNNVFNLVCFVCSCTVEGSFDLNNMLIKSHCDIAVIWVTLLIFGFLISFKVRVGLEDVLMNWSSGSYLYFKTNTFDSIRRSHRRPREEEDLKWVARTSLDFLTLRSVRSVKKNDAC